MFPNTPLNTVLSINDSEHDGVHVVRTPVGFETSADFSTAADVFVGYLLLDAWIANTDRHHENWGWVVAPQKGAASRLHLAPTFDHASSLGAHENDDNRRERLTTKDRGRSMERYVEKARSALYATEGERRPLGTAAAFEKAARRYPKSGRAWLRRLAGISPEDTSAILRRIPRERVSEVGIDFAQAILNLNRDRLVCLLEQRL